MDEIATNRDLYRFIAQVMKRGAEHMITLEVYLSNLQRLARVHGRAPTLTPAEVARLLEGAFDSTASTGSTTEPAEPGPEAAEGYAEWEARLDEQIRDLREMDAAGTLADEHRYFGVDAPSGARWYNFDPCTFIECAAAGTFGGWQEGDDTGRALVPGPVAVLDEAGELRTMELRTMDPREIEEPVVELQGFSWRELVGFLGAGQAYE
jgi:hypothetical protein